MKRGKGIPSFSYPMEIIYQLPPTWVNIQYWEAGGEAVFDVFGSGKTAFTKIPGGKPVFVMPWPT